MSWFTQNIRDPFESIAPTVIGGVFGGPAGAALAGQVARPFESKSAQASDLQKAVNIADLGLGVYGAYQGFTGGNPWAWGGGGSSAAPSAAAGANLSAGAGAGTAPDVGGMQYATDIGTGTAPASTESATFGGGSSVPTAPAATAPAAAKPGFTDYLTKYGPLAMYGLGQMGQMQQGQQMQKAMANVGAPQRAEGQRLLAQYQSGQINPGDQYAIDQWKQSAIAQSRQYFAQAGQSDSSQAKEAEKQIEAQAVNMRQTALQNILQQGLSVLNVTDQYQAQAIQMELQNSQQALANTTNFFNAYGQWLRTTPTMTGTAGTGGTSAPTAAAPA